MMLYRESMPCSGCGVLLVNCLKCGLPISEIRLYGTPNLVSSSTKVITSYSAISD